MSRDPMMELVLQVSDQLARGAELDTPEVASNDHVVVLGMGGSAMAARVAANAAAASPAVVHVHQSYGLPAWTVARRALVIAVSYSGNTEETLSGMHLAMENGLEVAAVSSGGAVAGLDVPRVDIPGGLPPRAALGWQTAAVMRLLEGAGIAKDAAASLTEAAEVTAASLGGGAGAGYRLGEDLGGALVDRIPIVIGASGPPAVAATRWVAQINENAKRVAIAAEIPEANHNALEAWAASTSEPGRFGVVSLTDQRGDARNERRVPLSAGLLAGAVSPAGHVDAIGLGALARFFSLAVVGDVASVVLAEAAGVAATPVAALEGFKRTLREE